MICDCRKHWSMNRLERMRLVRSCFYHFLLGAPLVRFGQLFRWNLSLVRSKMVRIIWLDHSLWFLAMICCKHCEKGASAARICCRFERIAQFSHALSTRIVWSFRFLPTARRYGHVCAVTCFGGTRSLSIPLQASTAMMCFSGNTCWSFSMVFACVIQFLPTRGVTWSASWRICATRACASGAPLASGGDLVSMQRRFTSRVLEYIGIFSDKDFFQAVHNGLFLTIFGS